MHDLLRRAFQRAAVAALLGVCLCVGYGRDVSAASLTGLGRLTTTQPPFSAAPRSGAYSVSADGSVAVGESSSISDASVYGEEAFRWTPDGGGMVGLGILPGGYHASSARSVSGDASVVVGSGINSTFDREAFRWTADGGMAGLGVLPGGYSTSAAHGVSADGSVIVGESSVSFTSEAFRWTSGGGMVGLGDLPGGDFASAAAAVSADGSVVVGYGRSASGIEAFRWTVEGGMVGLGDLPGGDFASAAWAISADGSVVVGQGSIPLGWTQAFRWTSGGGMVGLGDLPGGNPDSFARGVSGDGSVVVGQSNSTGGYEAFIWDEVHGMRSLADVLSSDYGVDLTYWDLTDATAISSDGSSIVGVGVHELVDEAGSHSWVEEAWIAVVPEPSTVVLFGAGLVALAATRRRRVVQGA